MHQARRRSAWKIAVTMALTACLAMLALAGCSSNSGSSGSGSSSTANSSASTQPTTVMVTDAAGRSVEIPDADNLTSIYSTSPIGQMYLFTIAPEKAGGSNTDYTEAELKYLPKGVGDLPNYGTWAMNGTLNNEALMASDVQVILDVSSSAITDNDISAANELQDQTGIPVLLFDGSVDKTPDTYRAIGKVLGTEDRAEQMASYCEKTLADVTAAVQKVPESERVSVYYAEGPDGLKTEPENSPHFTTFKVAGAKDAAVCDMTKGSGMTQVSLENVIAWNPDVIIAWDDQIKGGADDTIRTSSDWSSISAVQNGKVYTIPSVPYMWGDRPPSVTRYIGMQWLCNKLYPDYYNIDMVQTTKDFYSLFFSVTLTDDEAKEILGE